MTVRMWILALVGCLGMGRALCRAQSEPSPDSAGSASCKALLKANFSTLEDAPTEISDAQVVEAKGADPAYCRVQGFVWPQVGFELWLPTKTWNGKFIEIGCGGSCGGLNWTMWCP